MKKIFLSLFFLGYLLSSGYAQVLSLVPHPLQNFQHPFNEKFIQRNQITSIQVEISSKKEMDIIRAAYRFLVFEFNSNGRMVSEKNFKIGEVDTLNFAFEYNDEGRMILEQEYIGSGILEKKYSYDDEGNKKRVEYRKIDAFSDHSNLLSIDSIKTIILDDGTIVQTYFNDYGRQYRDVRVYFDTLGYLIRYRETFILSHKQNSIDYSYTDFGLLKEINYNFALNDKTRREEYLYNDEGVPDTFLIYENSELTERKEYLYNADGSLKAILFKEMETNLIKIWEMTYVKEMEEGILLRSTTKGESSEMEDGNTEMEEKEGSKN